MSQYRTILLAVIVVAVGILTTVSTTAQDLPTKYPLLELFTNTPCGVCGSQNPGMFNRLEAYEGEYHQVSFLSRITVSELRILPGKYFREPGTQGFLFSDLWFANCCYQWC